MQDFKKTVYDFYKENSNENGIEDGQLEGPEGSNPPEGNQSPENTTGNNTPNNTLPQ